MFTVLLPISFSTVLKSVSSVSTPTGTFPFPQSTHSPKPKYSAGLVFTTCNLKQPTGLSACKISCLSFFMSTPPLAVLLLLFVGLYILIYILNLTCYSLLFFVLWCLWQDLNLQNLASKTNMYSYSIT